VGDGVVDEEFVAGAAAGACAGDSYQSAIGGKAAFAAEEGGFGELRSLQIQMNLRSGGQGSECLLGGKNAHGVWLLADKADKEEG